MEAIELSESPFERVKRPRCVMAAWISTTR
jgi:hypothetical protein